MRFTTLKALDSSILACQLINIDIDEGTDSFIDDNHLHIYLRIKDGIEDFEDLYKVPDPQTIISRMPEGCNLTRNTKDDIVMKKYYFSKIFKPKTTQIEIFDELVKPKLLKFINGQNSTLLTYGVSSSGKTYTIVGTAEEPGVVPRSLEYLFRTLPDIKEVPTYKPLPYGKIIRLTEDKIIKESQLKEEILNFKWSNSAKCEHINTYYAMRSRLSEQPVATLEDDPSHLSISVWVSFAEIYNEHIYDLLQTKEMKKEKLKLGCANGKTYVKNLTLIHVTSGMEAYQVLQYGLHHLNYAKTNINNHSSRSHSIFTIWLIQTGKDLEKESHISHFNFCDLAGAERSKKTLNVGDRLKESNNINTSLLVLGRCISAVRKAQQCSKQNIVPFRESKLTQLFQKALSGLEDICMIVNINPCKELWEETQHVLNFSAIAKDIVVSKPPPMPVRRSERITQLLTQRLDNVIGTGKANRLEELKNELAEIIEKLEMEDMNQMKEIEMMRNDIISEYNQMQEERKEEMENEVLALRRGLMADNERKLQAIKSEIMQRYGISDDEPLVSSSEEVINVSSDEESDSEPNTVETVNLVSSDEEAEEEEEEEIDKWRRKVGSQEDLIAEHQKTISRLRMQINELKLKIHGRASEEDVEETQELEKTRELEECMKKKDGSLTFGDFEDFQELEKSMKKRGSFLTFGDFEESQELEESMKKKGSSFSFRDFEESQELEESMKKKGSSLTFGDFEESQELEENMKKKGSSLSFRDFEESQELEESMKKKGSSLSFRDFEESQELEEGTKKKGSSLSFRDFQESQELEESMKKKGSSLSFRDFEEFQELEESMKKRGSFLKFRDTEESQNLEENMKKKCNSFTFGDFEESQELEESMDKKCTSLTFGDFEDSQDLDESIGKKCSSLTYKIFSN